METVPMLADVDDEKHYAQLLEVAYAEAFAELDTILKEHLSFANPDNHAIAQLIDEFFAYEHLARLRIVMNCTVRQSVSRRRRLANVARGLADLVLDEEGA